MSNTYGNPPNPSIHSEEEWENHTPDFYQFTEAGQFLIGTLAPSETITVGGQPTERYTLETSDGPVAFLGGVQLDSLLLGLPIGTKIKLLFLGLFDAPGGRKYKKFELYLSKGIAP